MKPNKLFSIALMMVLFLSTSGYQVLAQQPISGSTRAGTPADIAGSLDLSTLLAREAKTRQRGISLMPESGDVNASVPAFSVTPMTSGNLPVTGGGTLGRLTKWIGFTNSNSAIGDTTIYEDKFGNVGIGTDSPISKLTVAGVIESTGGFKFPDGSVKTSAGVVHDATLKGDGTTASPLAVAAPAGEPFQREASASIPAGGFGGTATILVPANKRLLIEFASIRAHGFSPALQPDRMEIISSWGGEFTTYQLGPVRTVLAAGLNTHIGSQQVVIWADPGTSVSLRIGFPVASGAFTAEFAISGRLFEVLN